MSGTHNPDSLVSDYDIATVRSLAVSTGDLFQQGNKLAAGATFEKMMEVYFIHMRMPVAKGWSELPPLSEARTLAVESFASHEGVTARQAEEFGKVLDSRMRSEFERHIPRLKEININPAVTIDTMKSCVGNIMLERDKASEELVASASGVLGRIRSRFMAQNNGGDWNKAWMGSISSETFSHAVAHTAVGVARDASQGKGLHHHTLSEVNFLADLSEQHASAGQHRTLSLVSDVRRKAGEIEVTVSNDRAFA